MEASWIGLLQHARSLDPDPALRHLSDERLVQEVRDGASRIAALECEWLLQVGELIVRGVYADQGARTPGQWLSWACGLDGSTGREKARVALALRHLPKIRARFAEGTLSYSKVRALTRVAVPEIEEQLLRLADAAPASHLARILAAGRRSADQLTRWQDGPPVEDPPGEVRDVRRVLVDEDTVELRIRLPLADATALEERIERLVDLADRADRTDRADGDGEDGSTDEGGEVDGDLPRGARRAIAVCSALASAVAAGPPDRSGLDDHLVVVHVQADELAAAMAEPAQEASTVTSDVAASADAATTAQDGATADAGASADAPRASAAAGRAGTAGPRSAAVRAHVTTGRGRGMMLPRRVLARLLCDADIRLAGIAEDGHPADIGRRSRKVPADLRRALQLRDRHCRFPGCHRTRGLHAHHVVHWALGGPTDLSNLVLLCAHHHRFVHDRGWTLRPVDGTAGRWTFHAPGRATAHPAVLPLPGASADALAAARDGDAPHPRALQPPWWDGEWYDLSETVQVVADTLLDLAA